MSLGLWLSHASTPVSHSFYLPRFLSNKDLLVYSKLMLSAFLQIVSPYSLCHALAVLVIRGQLHVLLTLQQEAERVVSSLFVLMGDRDIEKRKRGMVVVM